jgi:hypothetical protein
MNNTIDTKTFADLRARAALLGYAIKRTDPADGPVVYLIEKFKLTREVEAAELAEMFKEAPSV